MKNINKKLSALAGAFLAASSSQAAFDEGSAVLYVYGQGEINTEGVLVGFESEYYADLGVTGQDLVNGVPVIVHDAALGAWLDVIPNSEWAVIATVNDPNRVANPPAGGDLASYTNRGFVGTSLTGSTGFAGITVNNESARREINDFIAIIKDKSDGQDSFYVAGSNTLGRSLDDYFDSSMINLDSNVSFFYSQANPNDGVDLFAPSVINQVGTAGTASSSAAFLSSDGTFTANAVPVPAAAWLFGSALAGLGLARRKK